MRFYTNRFEVKVDSAHGPQVGVLEVIGDLHSARLLADGRLLLGAGMRATRQAELFAEGGNFRRVVDVAEARDTLVTLAEEQLIRLKSLFGASMRRRPGGVDLGMAWDRHRSLWLARHAV